MTGVYYQTIFLSIILGLGKVWQNLYVCGIGLFSYIYTYSYIQYIHR